MSIRLHISYVSNFIRNHDASDIALNATFVTGTGLLVGGAVTHNPYLIGAGFVSYAIGGSIMGARAVRNYFSD